MYRVLHDNNKQFFVFTNDYIICAPMDTQGYNYARFIGVYYHFQQDAFQ